MINSAQPASELAVTEISQTMEELETTSSSPFKVTTRSGKSMEDSPSQVSEIQAQPTEEVDTELPPLEPVVNPLPTTPPPVESSATASTSIEPTVATASAPQSSPPLIQLETCDTEWKYGELPEHVVVQVFSYLHTHQVASGEERLMRGEWPETQIPLSQVCRRWNSACKHDTLWRERTLTIYKFMTKPYKSKPKPYSYYSSDQPIRVNVDLNDVVISDRLPKQPPTNDFQSHYIQFRKVFDEKHRQLLQEAKRKEWSINLVDSLFRKRQSLLHTITTTIGYLGFLLFIGLCVMRERLSWTPYIYLPIYLCLSLVPFSFAALAAIASMRLVSNDLRYDTFTWKITMKNHRIIGLLLIILDIPVLLTALNVGALPQLPDVLKVTNMPAWDRRWGLLPWHVVFAPLIILIFPGAGVFFSFLTVAELNSLGKHWERYSNTRMIECAMFALAGLAGFCFSIFFTLLGFHLEFPYHFHLAICFAPLYLAEVFGVFVFSAYFSMYCCVTSQGKQNSHKCAVTKCKATYSSGIESLTLFCTMLIPVSLIIGNIIVSLYQFLFAYAYLGLLLPATSVYVVLLLVVNKDILEPWAAGLQQKPAKDCCPTFCRMVVCGENKF